MWTAVFLAQTEESAYELKNKMLANNILIKIKPIINQENGLKCFEFYVPFAEVNQALELIIDIQE